MRFDAAKIKGHCEVSKPEVVPSSGRVLDFSTTLEDATAASRGIAHIGAVTDVQKTISAWASTMKAAFEIPVGRTFLGIPPASEFNDQLVQRSTQQASATVNSLLASSVSNIGKIDSPLQVTGERAKTAHTLVYGALASNLRPLSSSGG